MSLGLSMFVPYTIIHFFVWPSVMGLVHKVVA